MYYKKKKHELVVDAIDFRFLLFKTKNILKCLEAFLERYKTKTSQSIFLQAIKHCNEGIFLYKTLFFSVAFEIILVFKSLKQRKLKSSRLFQREYN